MPAAFVVPPGRALWVPAGLPHAVAMQGAVAMRALFLRADAAARGAGRERRRCWRSRPCCAN